jgi:phage terminase large subunit-like protein
VAYSVCAVWGVAAGHHYLLDVWRERVTYGDLKRAVRSRAQSFGASVVLIEDAGTGIPLIQELRAEGIRGITPYAPKNDKRTRMETRPASSKKASSMSSTTRRG